MKIEVTQKQMYILDTAQKDANVANMRVADIMNTLLAGHDIPEGAKLVGIEENCLVLELPDEEGEQE